MKDIKELALKVAKEMNWRMDEMTLETFATRLIAAYTEGQESVAWAYCPECGSEEIHYEEGRHKQCSNCHQEWFSNIDYSDVVQSNLSKLFTAPPEPAPNMADMTKRIATLEQQNAELVAALELCKKHMAGDKWDSLFIDGVLSKVKQP